MAAVELQSMLAIVPNLLGAAHSRLWVTYDNEADVLYINFRRPSHADDAELTDDDVVVRYQDGEIVGLTILNASKREQQQNTSGSITKLSGEAHD